MILLAFTPVNEALPEFKHYSSSYAGRWYSDWLYILTRHGEIYPSRLNASGGKDAKPIVEAGSLAVWVWEGLNNTGYSNKSVAYSPVVAWACVSDIEATSRRLEKETP